MGSGINFAMLTGEEDSGEILEKKGKASFKSNSAGGILGGFSTGPGLDVSFAVGPTSSFLSSRGTLGGFGGDTTISVLGRPDPCVGI
jgi:Chorismate synthase